MTATELVCKLSDALEAAALEDGPVLPLLHQLGDLASQADSMFQEILMDASPLLMSAAGGGSAADAAVRLVLSSAAEHCPAREVFTLCSAALAQQLSERCEEPPAAQLPACGPASPAFQLFLLGLLHRCLPRIRRRPVHFLADALQMQLRWAAEMLPALLLGDAAEPAPAAEQAPGSREAVTAAAAARTFVRLAGGTEAWVTGTATGQQQQQQLTAAEQHVALGLLGLTQLQLASITLQLPSHLEAGAEALAAAAHGQGMAGGLPAAPPAPGSRLPLMRAAAAAVLDLPLALLQAVPRLVASPAGGGQGGASSGGRAGRDGIGSYPMPTPEELQSLAASTDSLLSASGVSPNELSYFSEAEAREGAAVACAAACGLLASSGTSSSGDGGSPTAAQQAQWLRQLLPQAACCLLDLGAQHQSVALTLLPLCALCAAGRQVASAGQQGARHAEEVSLLQLTGSTAELDALLSALVGVMSFNPVQLLRSCAHDAVHAVLDAFQPDARLVQLRAMMQMPSSAAAVVALQRLRQEMAATWPSGPGPTHGAGSAAASGGSRGQPGGSSTRQVPRSSSSSSGSSQVWLSEEALALALPCMQRGPAAGWHDEASVLAAADVQAAALSALRWVLLRQQGAAPGQPRLVPPQRAAQLLHLDLLPLQACLERAMEGQAQAAADSLCAGGPAGSSQAAALPGDEALHGLLAAQRLQEVLASVLELLGEAAAEGASVA